MANSNSVAASLWWDPFVSLLTDLETASESCQFPPNLVKKVKDNRDWFVDNVKMFKPPNEKSKAALSAGKFSVGSRQLSVKAELKEMALDISSFLGLDEVQSYILVERARESKSVGDVTAQEFRPMVLIQYYIERQCLFKCIRLILMLDMHAGSSDEGGDAIIDEAVKLIYDGLESKLISLFEDQLSSNYPEQMDVDLLTIWAEETLIEEKLILDILFLIYHKSFSQCSGERWIKFCSIFKEILSGSYSFGKLAISGEAFRYSYHAKVQLLLILMETLDLEGLLQMVHDEVPFREGGSAFSLSYIQEMDALISNLNAFETKEAGPLILAWAVFLCLISSLPGKEEVSELQELNHVNYIRHAVDASSLDICLEILQSDLLRESDGPVAGYRSVLRTSTSSFIASYEINDQLENGTPNLILDILCCIYRGEESLCVQFWDRDSFIDAPIRCFLRNLEGDFPFRTVELLKFLSALCEGPWPAKCVFNFLHKSVGISSLFDISNESLVDSSSHVVETCMPLHVHGVEGFVIPSGTRGRVLKLLEGNTALVRWEYAQSGILMVLLHLAQQMYADRNEVFPTLELLNRMVSFDTAICFALLDVGNSLQPTDVTEDKPMKFWVVEIISTLIRTLSPNADSAAVMSMCVSILTKMLKCFPSQIVAVIQKADIFGIAVRTSAIDGNYDVISRGTWLLPGNLAKMLLIDCEHNENDYPLAISVLNFTTQLLETGLEDDIVLALVTLSLQYVLVNHEYWKYKVKQVRWKISLKVLEVMKKCITKTSSHSHKLSEAIQYVLLSDTSIHNILFKIICTTGQTLEKLYVSRLLDAVDIYGLETAISSVLDILLIMLHKFSKDISPGLPVFHQVMLSSITKPIPIVAAVLSLISYSRNPAIQVGAARLLSTLLMLADYSDACFSLDDKLIIEFRCTVECILKEPVLIEDLFVAVMNLLTSAAYYQPAFLVSIFTAAENMDVYQNNSTNLHPSKGEASPELLGSKKSSLVTCVMHYVEKSSDLFNSNPRVLLNVLNFLKALWQGTSQYAKILEWLKCSKIFWKQMSECTTLMASMEPPTLQTLSEIEAFNLASKYQCISAVLEIIGYETFLQKKLLHAEYVIKQASKSMEKRENVASTEKSDAETLHVLEQILSSWSKNSVLSKLIKLLASYEYDNKSYFQAKVATGLLAMHVMGKIETGKAGSLSVSLVQKMRDISNKLASRPAFSELSSQYSKHGYSEGKELKSLILNDLFYHMQGEFEGRTIEPGPFKELFHYILELKLFQAYESKYDDDFFMIAKDVYLYDTSCVQAELGLDLWDHSRWKESIPLAETMLQCMREANFMALYASSKLKTLRALTTLLTVYEDASLEKRASTDGKIPTGLVLSCIDTTCKSFRATTRSLAAVIDITENIYDFLSIQAELLAQLIKCGLQKLPLPTCVTILKTTVSGLRVLNELRPSVPGVSRSIKLLLVLLLLVIEQSYLISQTNQATDHDSVENFAEISNVCLTLLPLLCSCVTTTELPDLALSAIDLIVKNYLTPDTWFPIVQKHLHLQLFILNLQERKFPSSVPLYLKFFLTLASVKNGAEMLSNAGFFSCLKMMFSVFSDDNVSSSLTSEKPQNIWGLGLAVVTAILHSIGDRSICADVIEDLIQFFFMDKSYLVFSYLSAPDSSSIDHERKRPRAQRRETSLTALQETEQTLMLMCVLIKQWRSWVKTMKGIDSVLREKCIHLLSFISQATQRHGEPYRKAPLLCPPCLKEEFECCKKPSFVNSTQGWFALSCMGCVSKHSLSAAPSTTALVVKGQAGQNADHLSQTFFSDTVAVEMYRITFYLLRFLCLQVNGSARRAEEVGFVDLAQFPELPMPEILHGLQDQAMAIVSDVCEINKSRQVPSDIQSLCLLLLQIMEMALYLELCVIQICGMRPVLGRMEDFSKEVKLLMKAVDGHAFMKASVKSLRQMISLVYPGLSKTEGFL